MNMSSFRKGWWVICLLANLIFSVNVVAGEADTKQAYEIHGYDLVSYFDTGPLKGSKKIKSEYKGKTYLFASEINRQKFESEPERYLPAYEGNCAFGMVFGMESGYDPMIYDIRDNRLFLLINEGTLMRWSRRPDYYIEKGDKNWRVLSGVDDN